jgi:hypothetical protein
MMILIPAVLILAGVIVLMVKHVQCAERSGR